MKLTVPRETLLGACQLASIAVPQRSPKPILQSLKLVADPQQLLLMATDMDIGIRLTLRGNLHVAKPGEVLLVSEKMVSILRESLTDEAVQIEADDSRAIIRTETSEFEMPTADAASFPDPPLWDGQGYYEMQAGVLREMIHRTIFAVAKEAAKYTMTGVLWEVEGKTVRLVATDSKRLALAMGAIANFNAPELANHSHIVPTKVMQMLERHLQSVSESAQVRISLRSQDVMFATEGDRAVIVGRLVAGRFPPYREILPKKHTARVTLPVERFLAAVRQAAIMTDQESKRVRFQFTEKLLTLEAHEATSGRSKVQLPLTQYEGAAMTISFDPQNITEMLRVLPADAEVTLHLLDPARPAVFSTGLDYTYLVMPMA
jgi:DNA polymerase-3 subunit beta